MMDLHGICLYTGQLSLENDFITVEAEKTTLAADVIKMAVKKLKLGNPENFEVAEVFCSGGQLCKERCVDATENPVRIQLLWPKVLNEDSYSSQGTTGYRFYIRKKDVDFSSRSLSWLDNRHASPVDTFLTTFLKQPTSNKEYPDLCSLPDLNEKTLLDNIRARFYNGNIYTYVGSILIAVNPFKFFPIYNPKYVKMYQYKWLGDLPPHIFAIADAAFSTMLRTRKNQCIVISGESGSGKTESTNLLLHHLTALSQKGNHATGVEQTILGAGPVLEAFGNAKTVHNNNSSRFGKFIQVNYKEYGMVHGAIVEKYLLEKSRIVSQAKNERNYHVFYYLLKGASAEERSFLHLHDATEYHYLSQSNCYTVDGVDEEHEFARLKQSMEMVGFSTERQHRIFSVLSAVLHLGNVEFKKKGDLHHDESVVIRNEAVITVISNLLKVKETTLIDALTQKRTVAGGETVFMNYKMEDAIATRDALAKCLYGVLFDWIVLKVNHALLAKRHNSEHQVDFSPAPSCTRYDQNPPYTQGNSIGVLDIFGFEDFHKNSFEQFCINYANEHLQYYFNQHIFKLEQEEYQREGIQWKNIEFIDNTGCLELFSKKPNGLFCLLDEECNFPGASNDTLLSKFNRHHKGKPYYEVPQLREGAFVVVHYAGKVKYSTVDFREKNSDLIRTDIVGVLKNSSSVFVKELLGVDPVAILRWGLLRAFFRCVAAFISAGKEYQRDGKSRKPPKKTNETSHRESCKLSSDNLLRSDLQRTCCSNLGNKLFNSLESIRHAGNGDLLPVNGVSSPPSRERTALPLHENQTTSIACPFSTKHKQVTTATTAAAINTTTHTTTNSSNATPPHPLTTATDHFAVSHPTSCPSGSRVCGVIGSSTDSCHHSHTLGHNKMTDHVITSPVENYLPVADALVIMKAQQVIKKNKCTKSKYRQSVSYRDVRTLKTIATRTMIGGGRFPFKKQPPSVSAQFQWSLSRLMETLSQGNPFFVRCIKSNSEKAPCQFDDDLVLRQLHYTGMLATVKIRQSGYNYRLTFDEFIHQYKIILPNGLLSSKEDVKKFLECMDLNQENYQIGITKVFLREVEKVRLDEALHRAIMQRVITIQRWMKALLERQNFIKQRAAALNIQCHVRRFLAQRKLAHKKLERDAAITIQSAVRMMIARKKFLIVQQSVTLVQPFIRGCLARKRVTKLLEEARQKKITEQQDWQSSISDEGILTKGFSAEELELDTEHRHVQRHDSEESSGILEDSETEAVSSSTRGNTDPVISPVHTPASPEEEKINNVPFIAKKPFNAGPLEKRPLSRVQEMAQAFQRKSESSLHDCDWLDGRHKVTKSRSAEIPQTNNGKAKGLLKQKLGPSSSGGVGVGGISREGAGGVRSGGGGGGVGGGGGGGGEVLNKTKNKPQAPLARQESLSDLTSSPSGSYSLPYDAPLLLTILLPLQHHGLKHSRDLSSSALFPLISPEKQGNNERASMFVYEKQSTEGGGEKSVINISPFRRARKHFKNIMGDLKESKPCNASYHLMRHTRSTIQVIKDKSNRKGGRKDIPYDDSDDSIPDDLQAKMQRPLEIGAPTNLEYSPTFGHDEILQTSSYGIQVPCGPVLMDGRRASSNRKKPHRRGMRSKSDMKMPPTNWSVAGTSQWQYPEELMVSDIRELQLLDEFIYKKLMNLSLYNSQRDTICDVVFKKSLKEFHRDLTACLSIAMLKDVVTTQYRYRDLMNNFEQVLQAQVKNVGTNAAFPVTMGVNAFRGFLDEFMKESKEIRRKEKKEERKTESKSTKKERQKKDMLEYLGHKFLTVQFNIPTFCELCSSIIWIMEKGFVCQVCKYTCHKKCCFRSTTSCKGIPTPRANDGSVGNNQVFGFPLESLITDGENVPLVAEKLISAIELHGLYTVGLYRKCGAAAKVKQLKNAVDEEGIENVDLDEYPIHVLTTTLKCFFRELPEPLLTYDLYDDFIQASEIKESVEAIQALYAVTERLPKSNYHLFERLIFHLARVAQHEDSNKMSANGLAIIFVPCLLRTNKKMQAQESLQQVPKQSQCIESIISEQLRKLKATLADISTLNTAQATANDRLIYVRASIKSPKPGESPEEEFVEAVESPSPDNLGLFDARAEELALSAHIECIQKEKEDLTCNLPRLECQQLSSDDESNSVEGLLSNAPDCTDADETNEEYAVTFDLPVNPPSRLKHLNKRRVAVPHRHLPSKYRTRKPSDTRSHHHRPQPNFPIQIIANSGGYRRMRNAGLVLSLERLDDVQEDEIMV
ncbi:unconventional myosin-IXAa isoform X7 [Octopus sinensis]|uniref:Unconventional myosin-IXAa isoform X7 n=1 Tax=Octopus sinensis TaxID=2607531 RepID=A0A7E6F807_9MOLL|nr:unconventional myosin-IXAa isoform X7 [Octopus sinensis]